MRTASRGTALALALVLAAAPLAVAAQNHGGQTAPHAAPPAAPRPAPRPPVQPRPAPPPPAQPRPAQPVHDESGFNFPNDVNARPLPPPKPVTRPVPPAPGTNHAPANYRQPSFYASGSGGPYHGTFHGPVVRNPHHWHGWGWNHGVPWYPSPIYWGGGFWGPFAIGSLAAAALFGSIVDYQNQMIYPSYEVLPDSPGAQLLQNYGLQQTQCGPPNLVVIWGPDNSVICAFPNDLVAPGNYEMDPSTLTIVSSS